MNCRRKDIYIKYIGLFVIFLNCFQLSSISYGQQSSQFSQYFFNQPIFNPATAGLELQSIFSFTHRTQWAGYNPSFDESGRPIAQVFYATTQIPALRSGLGIHFVNYQLGAITNRELQLSYAFHVSLPNAKLAIGIRGGLYSINVDFNRLRPLEDGDRLILAGNETQTNPDIAVGIYYERRSWFLGLSTTGLLRPNFNFGTEVIEGNTLINHTYLLLGYNYYINNYWTIVPSVFVKTTIENPQDISFDFSTMINYNQKFFGALSYRYKDAATITAGAYLPYRGNDFRIAYSFDYTVQGQAGKQPGSHEFSLAYILPVSEVVKKPIIRTPRFIH